MKHTLARTINWFFYGQFVTFNFLQWAMCVSAKYYRCGYRLLFNNTMYMFDVHYMYRRHPVYDRSWCHSRQSEPE